MAKIIYAKPHAVKTLPRYLYPENPPHFSLEEMQAAVGGYIQFIYLPDHEILVIDEEGKLQGKRYTKAITLLEMHSTAIPVK